MRRLLVLLGVVILGLTFMQGSASARSVAPECVDAPAGQTTFIGGTIQGYADGRALNVHIGVSLGYKDSDGVLHIVQPNGQPNPTGAGDYSYIERINVSLPATGSAAPTGSPAPDGTPITRSWGGCVWGGVKLWYAEVYPKDPQPDPEGIATTNKERYGSSAYYAGTATDGASLDTLLRLPVTAEADAAAGSTGGVQGYIWYNGAPVPPSAITRVRAFPGPGSQCGVEGYSAAADDLLASADGQRTYYAMRALAGGQCGATQQFYSFQVTCVAVCGAAQKVFVKRLGISRGATPRFDVVFG